MIKEYKTIFQPGTGEIIEKKSRFIGYVRHVETEEEANKFIAEIKRKHYDARHNCYAYVLGENQSVLRFSDDGEPGGTAGKPILEVITGDLLCDVCIVVTRYFGGTLLGTGGLVRAYTDAAKACIDATEIVQKQLVIPALLSANYNDLGKIQYILNSEDISIVHCEYGETVELKVEIPFDEYSRIENLLIEGTSARIGIKKEEPIFTIH